MTIHEYQAKELFRAYGVPCSQEIVASTAEEAEQAAKALGDGPFVIKAQVHSGGRGKAGGVKLAHSPEEAAQHAQALLGTRLVTAQSGPEGKPIHHVLICRALDIQQEYYLSITLDRNRCQPVVIASAAGGTEIEALARTAPEKIHKCHVSVSMGLTPYQAQQLADDLGLDSAQAKPFVKIVQALYRLYWEKSAQLVEINPLALTGDGQWIAADAKLDFDNNALFLHPDIAALRDIRQEAANETVAETYQLNYVQLDGNVGCMVNGAGLAMATMDMIHSCGGKPANFLDVGGGATVENVAGGLAILMRDPQVKGILVNIFGGIMKCDVIAQGILEAFHRADRRIPMALRLAGTNAEQACESIVQSGLPITLCATMKEAANQICAIVRAEGGTQP